MKYIAILVLLFSSFSVFSYQVSPMTSDLLPMGSGSQQTMRITNTSNKTLAIEVSAYSLQLDGNGNEVLKESEDDFLIIPMTTVVPAGKAQSVIVRYIGEPMLKASEAYRIFINQVVVDLEKGNESGVNMTVNFKTLLNIVPEGSIAKLAILGKKQAQNNTWDVMLENTGNKYIRLSKAKWVVKDKDKEVILEGRALSEALSGKLLLPNSKIEVSLTLPESFDAESSTLDVIL